MNDIETIKYYISDLLHIPRGNIDIKDSGRVFIINLKKSDSDKYYNLLDGDKYCSNILVCDPTDTYNSAVSNNSERCDLVCRFDMEAFIPKYTSNLDALT